MLLKDRFHKKISYKEQKTVKFSFAKLLAQIILLL